MPFAQRIRLAAAPLGRGPSTLRSNGHRRSLCSALDAFSNAMQRGLGLSDRLAQDEEAACSALGEHGWCALDGILEKEAAARIRAEMSSMYRDGQYQLSYSHVVETGEELWRPNVWMRELDGDSWRAAPTLVIFLSELMRELPDVVNRGFRASEALRAEHQPPMISSSIFGHKLAVSTAGGARYPKHLDNVSGGADKRKLTAIYYPNGGWDVATQGGGIRLYDSLEDPTSVDVAPAGDAAAATSGGGGDRLLLFWSDLIVHEVLPMRVGCGGGGGAGDDDEPRQLDEAEHRHTFTVWLTTENDASLCDPRSPLYRLRTAHYPDKEE